MNNPHHACRDCGELSASQLEFKIKATTLRILEQQGPEKTLCPSAVARRIAPDDWRRLLPEIRKVADILKDENRIEILQKNRSISSAQSAKGPIQLRLKAN